MKKRNNFFCLLRFYCRNRKLVQVVFLLYLFSVATTPRVYIINCFQKTSVEKPGMTRGET